MTPTQPCWDWGRKEGGTTDKMLKDKISGKVTRNEVFCLNIDVVGRDRHVTIHGLSSFCLDFDSNPFSVLDRPFDKMYRLDKRLMSILSY